jgi:nucleoside-diphosphate-sugar epimerase
VSSRRALEGTPLRLSRPGIVRDWVYVDDVVDLYLECAARAGDVRGRRVQCRLGSRFGPRHDRFHGTRAHRLAREPQWGAFPAPAHDAHPWVADPGLTFGTFAWRPRVPLEDGLRRTIEAMRADGRSTGASGRP